MNKDTIYREDAIKAVENVSENYTKEGDREWHPHIDFITQALVEVPSVPSSDRPQGEWKPKNHHTDYCSNCGFEETQWRTADYNFCPSCGAKMKGADDE